MTTLTEIKRAVTNLSRKDFNKFCDWFSALDQRKWDREFEEDAQTGLPFPVEIPNKCTSETLEKSKRGEEVEAFDSLEEMFDTWPS